MKKYLLIFSLIFLQQFISLAQLEYSNWYFGSYSGITFNTPTTEPISFSGNKISQFEGCATISDKTGKLLFNTNGEYVINKNGTLINLGNPLYGHQTSTQSAIIIPKPGSNHLYYIFTADAGEYLGNTNRGINYSVLDINANLGEGGLVEVNKPLIKPACEQLTAVYHANNNDVWIVARGWKNNNFYSFRLSDKGIIDTVVTSIGFTRTNEFHTIGSMKISPTANMAAITVYDEQFIELYKFDNKTGIFSDRIQVNIPDQVTLYGVEFSSNGKVLYVSSSKNSFGLYSIYQINVTNYDAQKISQSQIKIAYNDGHVGALQRGMNNKIYLAHLGQKYLHSIESPNTLGTGCRFKVGAVFLLDSGSQLGLPQTFREPLNSKAISICEGNDVTLDTDEFLADTSKYSSSYKWSGPNGWESFAPKPVLTNLTVSDSGQYKLNVTYIVNEIPIKQTYTIYLSIGEHISFTILGKDTICKGSQVSLIPDTVNASFTYLWSNGRRTAINNVSNPGIYKLYITSQFGCVDTAEFRLTVLDPPKAIIVGDKLICNNKPVELRSVNQASDYNYVWSTGDTTPSIFVEAPGLYKLWISNKNGCSDSTSIRVVRYQNLNVKILGDTLLCVPGSNELTAIISPFDTTLKYSYLWSTGDSSKSIIATKPGIYKLNVTVENVCFYNVSIEIKKGEIPKIKTNAIAINEVCEGESITVDLLEREQNVQYFWSDGSSIFPRIFKTKGNYSIIALGQSGCTNKFDFSVDFTDKPKAEIYINDIINLCNADTIVISAYPKGLGYKYTWLQGGNSDTLVVRNSGKYYVVVENSFGCTDTTSINIELGNGIPVSITGNNFACKGSVTELKANPNLAGADFGFSYKWSTGDTTQTITVDASGNYFVEVSYINGCIGYDTATVNFLDVPVAELNYKNEIKICKGDSITIYPINKNPNWTYYWSDGSIATQKVISKAGVYKLLVYNTGACVDSTEIKVSVIENPISKIKSDSDLKLCKGETIELKSVTIDAEYKYLWSTGSDNPIIQVTSAGIYKLKITNSNGCIAEDSIRIRSAIEPTVQLTATKTKICKSDTIYINAEGKFESIIWSTGDTTSQITVTETGIYDVIVTSEDGCTTNAFIEIFLQTNNLSPIIKDIYFGTICPGMTENKFSNFINTTLSDLEIIGIESNNDHFKLQKDLRGLIIAASDSLEIPISFSPKINGNFETEFKIIYRNICIDSITFKVSGSSNFESVIKLPDVVVESGAKYCIPIYYEIICSDTVNFVSGATVKIMMIAEYFYPDSIVVGTILENKIINSIRHLVIRFDDLKLNSKEGIIGYICGTALLGNDSTTALKISSFDWDLPLQTSYIDGSITSTFCAIDLRPIRLFKPTTLAIYPNPSKDFMNITVNSEEKGIFVIELINYSGEIISAVDWSRNEHDNTNREIKINCENLSSGVYALRLRSPWNILSSKVIIIK